MISIFNDFLSLFFPNVCLGCGNGLAKGENVICTFCDYHLPQTGYHLQEDNPVEKHFWGRVQIEHAASLYYFNKATKVQRLLHHLKYKGKREVGLKLGNIYGHHLKESPFYETIDIIIPVPLHFKRQRMRTFNQSELFAEGLSESMQVPWERNILKREVITETQTRKSRLERWQNVKAAFTLCDPEAINGKHILLVDDVITTGATLEACSHALLEAESVKVSIATIAVAQI